MKQFIRFGGILLLVFAAFCAGFALKDVLHGRTPSYKAFKSLAVGGSVSKTPTEIFRDHYGLIQARSYRKANPDRLKYAAMQGLFGALGDPHTLFLEPVTAESFAIDTRGDYTGIGARLGPHELGAQIAVVFKGFPAEKAGLRIGDVVIAVDGEPSVGKSVTDIVDGILGKEGTLVRLRVLRQGEERPINIPIRRARVIIPTAESLGLEELNIGYVVVSGFAETTPQQFRDSVREAIKPGPDGLIIDLRGNPGGLLDTVEEMLSLFLDGDLIVSVVDRSGKQAELRAKRGKTLNWKGPTVILINGESASASEIFAGALQQHGLAVLVGDHSYGKASVQNVIPLVEGSSAKITIAKYLLPNQLDISRVVDEDGGYVSGGLKPDVEMELDISNSPIMGLPGSDSQLDAAISVIQNWTG